jgi:hypothetical protein
MAESFDDLVNRLRGDHESARQSHWDMANSIQGPNRYEDRMVHYLPANAHSEAINDLQMNGESATYPKAYKIPAVGRKHPLDIQINPKTGKCAHCREAIDQFGEESGLAHPGEREFGLFDDPSKPWLHELYERAANPQHPKIPANEAKAGARFNATENDPMAIYRAEKAKLGKTEYTPQETEFVKQVLARVVQLRLAKADGKFRDTTIAPFSPARVYQALNQAKVDHEGLSDYHHNIGMQKFKQGQFDNAPWKEQEERYWSPNSGKQRHYKRSSEHTNQALSLYDPQDYLMGKYRGVFTPTPETPVFPAEPVGHEYQPHEMDQHLRPDGSCAHCNAHVARALGMEHHLPMYELEDSKNAIPNMIRYAEENTSPEDMAKLPTHKTLNKSEPEGSAPRPRKSYDYSHLLPVKSIKEGYKIHLRERPGANGTSFAITATHQGRPVGAASMDVNRDGAIPHLTMMESTTHDNHSKKGIGQALREAGYAHGRHVHGITHVVIGDHAPSAEAVHRKLVEKHGMVPVKSL